MNVVNLLKDLTWLLLEKKETYKIEIFRSSSKKKIKLPSRIIDAMIELEDCGFKFYWNGEEKAYMIISKTGMVWIVQDKDIFSLLIKESCKQLGIPFLERC